MIMFKFFYSVDDSQPAFFLNINPQNPDVQFEDSLIVEIAKKLRCQRVSKITERADWLFWWVDK